MRLIVPISPTHAFTFSKFSWLFQIMSNFKVLWISRLSKITSKQWQFVVSTEQWGRLVKARRPLAHGDHALAQIDKQEVKSIIGGGFWYAISAKALIVYCRASPSVKESPQVLDHEESIKPYQKVGPMIKPIGYWKGLK